MAGLNRVLNTTALNSAGVWLGIVSGTATINEAADTASAAAEVLLQATATINEAADTLSASGTVQNVVSGTADITEDDDTLTASAGQPPVLGTADITEGDDTVTGQGDVLVSAGASLQEDSDASAGAGLIVLEGIANITEADDTLTAFSRQPVKTASLFVRLRGSAAIFAFYNKLPQPVRTGVEQLHIREVA